MKQVLIITFNTLLLFSCFAICIYFYGIKTLPSIYEPINPWGFPKAEAHKVFFKDGLYKFGLIDKDGMRINEKIQYDGDKHIIITGGSNTFGYLLSDNETIDYLIDRESDLTAFNPYIFAYPGWGLNNILAFFENKNIKDKVTEQEGLFIYQHIHDHFARFCGADSYFNWNQGISPVYEIKNKKLIRNGFFKDKFKFHLFLFKRGLRNLFQIEMENNLEVKKEDANKDVKYGDCFRTYVEGIKRLEKLYLSLYPKGKFYVVKIYERDNEYESQMLKHLSKVLIKNKIKFIDSYDFLSKDLTSINHQELFDESGHVNATYYKKFLPMYREIIMSY